MPKSEQEIEAEVKERGLTPYFWDGEFHSLPHYLAEKYADFIAELKRDKENEVEK